MKIVVIAKKSTRNGLKLKVLSALFALLLTGAPAFAAKNTVESTKHDEPCAHYQQGPLVTRRIAVYYEPPSENLDAFNWVDIHHRYEYVFQPNISWSGGGGLNHSALFEIEIETGQPRSVHSQRLLVKPSEATDFNLLVLGLSYKAPARVIGILAGRPFRSLDMGHMEDGRWVFDPGPFIHTGEIFHGYERIVVPDGQEFQSSRYELFIRESASGEISGVLRCSRIGTVSNPGCSLYEQIGLFDSKYHFRRNQMSSIEKIRNHAHAFVACLTWEG